jgi:membrane protein YdbS with pleckstrin-like domain
MLLIKPSAAVILKKFLLTDFIIASLIFLLTTVFDFNEYFDTTRLSNFFELEFLIFLFAITVQIIFAIIIFQSWNSEFYQIKKDRIVHKKSWPFGNETIFIFSQVPDIKYEQTLIGRKFKYGTIQVHTGNSEVIELKHIPKPKEYITLIYEVIKFGKQTNGNGLKDLTIKQILQEEEGSKIEFKSSALWDYKENKYNKELIKPIIKTITAMLNREGGYLIVGLNDNKEILGLEKDFDYLKKKDKDGFEAFVIAKINQFIGKEFVQYVNFRFEDIDNKIICSIKVEQSRVPVFFKLKEAEEFYIRTGNSTNSLSVREATEYINIHFKD